MVKFKNKDGNIHKKRSTWITIWTKKFKEYLMILKNQEYKFIEEYDSNYILLIVLESLLIIQPSILNSN